MKRLPYRNWEETWETFIRNCAPQTLLRRAEEILVFCGCGTCGRRLTMENRKNLNFMFLDDTAIPSDVVCPECMKE